MTGMRVDMREHVAIREQVHAGLSALRVQGRQIWGDTKHPLYEIVVRLMVGVGDVARLTRDGTIRPGETPPEMCEKMTTQSEDPNERVDHPRHYNQHPSGIETIELIEHLPCNFANAVKYIWRCGLKATETPLRDLKSARWYTDREARRIELYELDGEPKPKTEVVWRALARQVIEKDSDDDSESYTLAEYLRVLLDGDIDEMLYVIDSAIQDLEEGRR